jgi:hypothetical protein
MFDALAISSPKRDRKTQIGWEGFFPYYAGYPTIFAKQLLESSSLQPRSVIFDPWNGSGTTIHAASQLGHLGIGFDLNPVMVVVARARMLSPNEADSIVPLGNEIAKASRFKIELSLTDPLIGWFDSRTARTIRAIERSICNQLIGNMTISKAGTNLDHLSSIAATFYVALFGVCRELAKPFQSSNPTWLRMPKDDDVSLSIAAALIRDRFLRNVGLMAAALASVGRPFESTPTEIRLADSTSCSLPAASVDLALCSPPYCTRIDYTAATRVELAVLSPFVKVDAIELSRQMLGSTRVPRSTIKFQDHWESWGVTCRKFLRRVKSHSSKASAGYYLETHADYFDKLARSISAISLALKDGAPAIMVVQDSYYKDVHNDLPTMLGEIASQRHLKLRRREDFYSKRSMSGINRKAKAYVRRPGAVESVLCFEKERVSDKEV